MTDQMKVPRRSRGERPYFHDDAAIDQLYAMFVAMSGELAVARDRIDTLERLLHTRGLLGAGEVDSFVADDAAAAAREQRRQQLIARLFAPVTETRDRLAPATGMAQYERTLDELKHS